MSRIKEAQRLGTSVWLDFISRELIRSGRLKRLIDQGLMGLTSNPTIFEKTVAKNSLYDADIGAITRLHPDIETKGLYEELAVRDIKVVADMLRPVYDASGGNDGLVSLEASPHLAYDTRGTIAEVRRLWVSVDRPNVLIKVAATPQGLPAIESLTAEGININITLMFSTRHYEAVSHAYIRGTGRNPRAGAVTSVASFFVSRVDTYVDRELERIGTPQALALRGKAAVANTKLAYHRFREIFDGVEFAALRERGIRVQRPVLGSTSTKNPAYPDTFYVDELIGPGIINTMPIETLEAFLDHGRVRESISEGLDEAERVREDLGRLGIDFDAIGEPIQAEGVRAFAESFDKLLETLEKKRRALVA